MEEHQPPTTEQGRVRLCDFMRIHSPRILPESEHRTLEGLPEVHALERLDMGFDLDVLAEAQKGTHP